VRRCAEPEKAATGMYSEIQTTLPGSPRKLNQGWVPEQHVRVLAVRPAVALGAAHDSSQGRRDHFRDGAPVAWAGQMTSRSHRVRARWIPQRRPAGTAMVAGSADWRNTLRTRHE
jgi:hypothetical protein